MSTPKPQSLRPLPHNAIRVFEGKLYDIYQWEQILFDGSTATYEKLKGKDVVSVIPITADGKFIITHQQQPGSKEYITTAGGRVEAGEKVKVELVSFDEFVGVVTGDLYNDSDVKMEFLKAKLDSKKMEFLIKLLTTSFQTPSAT